jgi:plasmid stabilization system protein ParE
VKYRYDSEAREEYRNAIHFYGKAAERFFNAIESTVERIRKAPTQFREVEPGVRVCRVPNFPYAIYWLMLLIRFERNPTSSRARHWSWTALWMMPLNSKPTPIGKFWTNWYPRKGSDGEDPRQKSDGQNRRFRDRRKAGIWVRRWFP